MTIRVSDTFDVDTDTILTAHTPTPTGDGWTEEVRTGSRYQRIRTADDEALSNAGENSDRHIYTAQPNSTGAEYDVEAQLNGVPGGAGTDDPWFLVARLTGTGDYYSAGVYPNAPAADKKIFKTVGGTPTELASGAMSAEIAANDILMFEVRDATKKLYKNAAEELSTANNDITASGRAGFGLGNAWISTDDISTSWKTDNFEIDEVAGGTLYYQTNEGVLTYIGDLVKQTGKVNSVAGELTPAGVITRLTSKVNGISGGLTFEGAVAKSTSKVVGIEGALSFVGDLTAFKVVLQLCEGGLTFVGDLLKQAGKVVVGELTSSGTLSKATAVTMEGELTPSGVVSKSTSKVVGLTGALTFAGDLTAVKLFVQLVGGALSFIGTVSKQVGKVVSGSLTPTGAISKSTSVTVEGSITPTGDLDKQVNLVQGISGALSFVGMLITQFIAGGAAVVRRFIGSGFFGGGRDR